MLPVLAETTLGLVYKGGPLSDVSGDCNDTDKEQLITLNLQQQHSKRENSLHEGLRCVNSKYTGPAAGLQASPSFEGSTATRASMLLSYLLSVSCPGSHQILNTQLLISKN